MAIDLGGDVHAFLMCLSSIAEGPKIIAELPGNVVTGKMVYEAFAGFLTKPTDLDLEDCRGSRLRVRHRRSRASWLRARTRSMHLRARVRECARKRALRAHLGPTAVCPTS